MYYISMQKSAGHHPDPQRSQVSVEGDAAGDPEAPSTDDNNTPTSSTRPSQHTTDSAATREKELLDKVNISSIFQLSDNIPRGVNCPHNHRLTCKDNERIIAILSQCYDVYIY